MNIIKSLNLTNLSIGKKIYLLVAIAIIPISISTIISLMSIYNKGVEGNFSVLSGLTNRIANNLDDFIDKKKYNLHEISKNEQIINLFSTPKSNSSAIKTLNEIKNYISAKDSKTFLSLINLQGECIFCDDALNMKGIKNLPIFKEVLEDKTYVNLSMNKNREFELIISHPVKNNQNEIIGVIIFKSDKLEQKYIWDDFSYLLHDKQKANILLADTNTHNLLISNQLTFQNQDLLMTPLKMTGRDIKQLLTHQNGSYYQDNYKMYAFATLPKQGWIMSVNVPKEERLEYLSNLFQSNTRMILITVGIIIFITLHFCNTISQPIRVLIKTAKAVDLGDFEKVYEIARIVKIRENNKLTKSEKPTKRDGDILIKTSKRQDDLGQLTRVFIQMASNVKEREQNLHKQVEKLHIKIDQQKKMRDVENLTDNESFENLKSTVNNLKNRRKNMSCIIT